MGGLVVSDQFYEGIKCYGIKYFPVNGNNRFTGLKLFFGKICYLLLNVYMNPNIELLKFVLHTKKTCHKFKINLLIKNMMS